MKNLCMECMTLFDMRPPSGSYSFFEYGKCEGCTRITDVSNPKYFIKEVKSSHDHYLDDEKFIVGE